MRLVLFSLTIALSSLGGAAMAAEPIPAEVSPCLGAYGALADQAQALSVWSSLLGRSNLKTIDWAARRAKLLKADSDSADLYEATSGPYLEVFKMRMAADRINGTAADTSAILELSVRCDQAFHYSPSFAIP